MPGLFVALLASRGTVTEYSQMLSLFNAFSSWLGA